MSFECKRCLVSSSNESKGNVLLHNIFNSYDSLRRHVARCHKVNSTLFYVEFHLDGIWPKCKCGCKQLLKWSPQLKGFREFVAGHQSKIHNNWGHNQKAIDKSSETRRKQYTNGERKVWNDGLTIEDDRVKKHGKLISKSFTQEKRDKYSEIMKKNRLSGIVPTLYGSESSQWKGGVSEINNIARSDKRLYEEWKYPILVRDGFKCKECSSIKQLHVHHDSEPMCAIVKKHVVDEELVNNWELKKAIADKIVDYHITNKVSGITLCGECHQQYHPSLNFV